MYKSSKDGKAICSSRTAGIKVHTHSTICISSKFMLMNFSFTIITIIKPTKVIINTKIKLIKSCKCDNSSIKGVLESWKFSCIQVPTLQNSDY